MATRPYNFYSLFYVFNKYLKILDCPQLAKMNFILACYWPVRLYTFSLFLKWLECQHSGAPLEPAAVGACGCSGQPTPSVGSAEIVHNKSREGTARRQILKSTEMWWYFAEVSQARRMFRNAKDHLGGGRMSKNVFGKKNPFYHHWGSRVEKKRKLALQIDYKSHWTQPISICNFFQFHW